MDPDPYIPVFHSLKLRRFLQPCHIGFHLKCCQDNLDRICSVLLRNSSCTHVCIANGLDLFYTIFLNNGIEIEEEFIELIYQDLRIKLLCNPCETLNIGKQDCDKIVLDL